MKFLEIARLREHSYSVRLYLLRLDDHIGGEEGDGKQDDLQTLCHSLLYHPIRLHQRPLGNLEADLFGGLEIDHELELHGSLHG